MKLRYLYERFSWLLISCISLTACGEFRISQIFEVTRPSVLLTSPDVSESTHFTFTPKNCDLAKSLYITENVSFVPTGKEAGWVPCSSESNSLRYDLVDQTVGAKKIRIWGKDARGTILEGPKEIPVKYAPKFLLGQDNENVFPQFAYGYFNPSEFKKIGSKYYVVNSQDSNVMAYNSVPSVNFPIPDLVLGQKTGRLVSAPSTKANRLAGPMSVASDGTRLAIADLDTHRVLIWNTIPTSAETPADIVLGQTDFQSGLANKGAGTNTSLLDCSMLNAPYEVTFVGGKLLVVDTYNNRVLIWNSIPTSNAQAADVVVGQSDCNAFANSVASVSASTLRGPRGAVVDAGGRLYVSDYNNHRILIWNSLPTSHGQAADLVLGQSSFTTSGTNQGGLSASSLKNPRKLAIDGSRLAVADSGNHRVLLWNTLPTANAQAADVVLGQANFSSGTANTGTSPSLSGLNSPFGVSFIDGNLWVADTQNNRLLKFNGIPASNGVAASLVVGQTATTTRDRSFGIGDHTFNRVADFNIQADGSLAVFDYGFSRVVFYNNVNDAPVTPAVGVFGQSSNQNGLPNRGNSTIPSSTGLYNPRGMVQVQNRTFIVDEANARVLGFNSAPLSPSSVADFVLGQQDLNSRVRDVSASSFAVPYQATTDGTKFAVVDSENNRVLIWNSIPSSTAQPADVVVGQPDMTSNTANNGGLSARTLRTPRGVLLAENKMYVSDTGNRRILLYDPIPTTNGAAAVQVFGQNDFTSALFKPSGLSPLQTFQPIILKYSNGHFVTINQDRGAIYIWNGLPTKKNQEADYAVGYNATAGPMGEYGRALDYETIVQTYTATSDGTRIWVPGYYGARLVAFPIPAITPETNRTRDRNLRLSIDSCENRSAILFNEGSEPSPRDTAWQRCPTSRWGLSVVLSAGDGVKKLKAWFKDEDGFVMPFSHEIPVVLITTYDQQFGLSMVSPAITNSSTVSFATDEASTQRGTSIRYLVSETNSLPSESDGRWVDANDGNVSYNLSSLTDGTKILYVWAMDIFGNISAQPMVYRIVYDSTPPTSPTFNLSGTYLGSRDAQVRVTVNSCADLTKVYFSDSGIAPTSNSSWSECVTTTHGYTVTLNGALEGNHNVYGWSMDRAGNISSSATILSANFTTNLTLGQVDAGTVATAASATAVVTSIGKTGSRFILTDSTNGRVLIYNGDPLSNAPAVVLGKPNLTTVGRSVNSLTSDRTLGYPIGAIIVGTKVIVTDQDNDRVLIWNSIPTVDGTPADVVLGQPDMASGAVNNGGISCSSLSSPRGLASDGTRLVVADGSNNRVLIWNSIPTTNFAPADVVIGQSNCTGQASGSGPTGMNLPYGLTFSGSTLFVSDYGNHRVLGYSTVPTSHGASASFVVGQPNLNSNTSGTTASLFKNPRGLFAGGGKFFVADGGNNRVLIFNSVPTVDSPTANVVLGQADFTSGSTSSGATRFSTPTDVFYDGTNAWVTEGNNKIKRFAEAFTNGMTPTVSGAADTVTMAVANLRSTSATTASAMMRPSNILGIGGKFLVSDSINNRILIWNSMPTSSNQAADVVIGHMDMTTTTANDTAVSSQAGRLNNPMGLATDGTKLFIADYGNNRILIYDSVPTTNGALANVAVGQSSLTATGSGTSATQLKNPYGVGVSGGKLFVADSGNNRVLIWNTVPTGNGAAASVVLGQSLFTTSTSNTGGLSASSLYSPRGIAFSGTKLLVTDSSNDRVLIWNTIPTVNAAAADVVVGQANFTAAGTSVSSTFSTPYMVRIWNSKLFVVDRSRHRVVIYNSIPTVSGALPDSIWGQSNNSSAAGNRCEISGWSAYFPHDIYFDGTSYWVSDDNHRVVKISIP